MQSQTAMLFLDYSRHRESVGRLCSAWGVPFQDRDDVLQESVLRAIETYQPDFGTEFNTWVVTQAKGVIKSMFNRDQKEQPTIFTDAPEEDDQSILVPFVTNQDGPIDWMPFWYKSLLLSLSERQRKILGFMLSGEKASSRSIAPHVGVSHATVNKEMSRIRDQARKEIAWTRALERLAQHWADTRVFQ